jgi:hypothetical protein
MSVEFKLQVRELVWQLVQKHYNVDIKQPYMLTSKSIVINNPINEIADSLANFIEQLLMEVANQKETKESLADLSDESKPESFSNQMDFGGEDDGFDDSSNPLWPLWDK